MTSEVKNFIEISDILKMRFQCSHCATALELSLEEVKKGTIMDCPTCHRDWTFIRNQSGAGASYEAAFINLARIIREVEETLEKVTPGVKLKLEISSPPATI